ncbi:MAG: hypothetical protein HY832_03360 [Candidatus Aenigmarchaeota archaeon]|nr:hypothetical protein [Candidatus Aenigmarchaeota archaeon]
MFGQESDRTNKKDMLNLGNKLRSGEELPLLGNHGQRTLRLTRSGTLVYTDHTVEGTSVTCLDGSEYEIANGKRVPLFKWSDLEKYVTAENLQHVMIQSNRILHVGVSEKMEIPLFQYNIGIGKIAQ